MSRKTLTGCGVGKTCKVSESNGSFCDRCDFNKNSFICGSWRGSYVATEPTAEPEQSGVCVLSEDLVFTGLNGTFIGNSCFNIAIYKLPIG